MDQQDILDLGPRLGPEHLGARLRAQVNIMSRVLGGMGRWHWENLDSLMGAVRLAFRASGLGPRGRANAVDFEVVERRAPIRGLPPAFRGGRLLHLTDLHIDGHPGLGPALRHVLAGLAFDACVITGDFRFLVHGPHRRAVEETAALRPALDGRWGVFAVLGNHDFVEMVPPLEAAGIRFLLNEAVALEAGGDRLWLAGVDDPHYYGTHDLGRAYRAVPPGAPSVLLCHSPELASAAAASRRPDLYLCGHTHGGQICLPGGRMVLRNVHGPGARLHGAWEVEGMPGYTSRGVGTSGVPLRFNCRPEIVVHTLVPARRSRRGGPGRARRRSGSGSAGRGPAERFARRSTSRFRAGG